jgi:hypothetical protein
MGFQELSHNIQHQQNKKIAGANRAPAFTKIKLAD